MDEEENQQPPLLDLEMLKAVSVLGRGAKGVAFLIRNENETLALKVISKASSIKKKNNKQEEEKRIWFERDVLNMFNHPLLPKLRGLLSTTEIVGFAIDYCCGGDLNALRRQQTERMFSNDVIRFYAAELVLVLEYLHELGVIYRDLKPENILIQENGHLMIVDFDLSAKLSSTPSVKSNKTPSPSSLPPGKIKKKQRIPRLLLCNSGRNLVDSVESRVDSENESVDKSNSFVGTEEYVAPEIIIGSGHDYSVDWWSLGVVLYEMLYGRTPFRGINRKETFYRILSKSPELVGEPTDLRDLIGKLLEKDPMKRIAVQEIKGHDYFKGVNWDSILQISRPPYIPLEKWDDENDLEEMDGIDLQLAVKGIFDGEKAKKEKISETIEKDNKIGENIEKGDNIDKNIEKGDNIDKNIWVEGLRNPAKDADFLLF